MSSAIPIPVSDKHGYEECRPANICSDTSDDEEGTLVAADDLPKDVCPSPRSTPSKPRLRAYSLNKGSPCLKHHQPQSTDGVHSCTYSDPSDLSVSLCSSVCNLRSSCVISRTSSVSSSTSSKRVSFSPNVTEHEHDEWESKLDEFRQCKRALDTQQRWDKIKRVQEKIKNVQTWLRT